MIKTIIGKVWKYTPSRMRLKVIRSIQKKFTASVVAIVTNEKQEILVLNHYFRPAATWGLPGGFIERGEQSEEAIKREIKEETDLELKNLRLVRVRTIRSHLEILFIAEGIGEAKVNSREIKEVGWFALDKLPEKMSKSQKEMLEKLFEDKSMLKEKI